MVATSRSALVGSLAAAAMIVSLGVAVPASGAATVRSASPSAFCSTVYTYHPTAPSGTNYANYRKWAKSYLGFYQKLASEAPNSATKKVLNEIVTVLKYESSQKNVKALGLYVAKNQKYWVKASKSLAAAIITCAKSLA
jgi:hypothetical protein